MALADSFLQSGKVSLLSSHTVLLILFTLLLTLGGVLLYRLCLHPLARFPGPFEAKFSGTWRARRFWRGTWHDDILAVHRRYGKVVRIAPNELSIVDERCTKLLYGHGSAATKTDWYATWDDPIMGPGLFAARSPSLHAFLRKRVSAVYSMSAMLRYEDYMQSSLTLMIDRLQSHAQQHHVVDMADWTNALAFDVVGQLAYGAPLGHLETESDHMGIRRLIHQGFFLMSNMGHYWGQSRWIQQPGIARLKAMLGFKDPFAWFRDWTGQQIIKRGTHEGKVDREDMLSHFLRMRGADGEPASFEEVQMEAANIIGAGADTTSIAMRACLYYLGQHPAICRQIRDEIDEFHSQHDLHTPITYKQTQELPLMCAAIREAIRLFPSIVYPLVRHAPPGMDIDGMKIPVNTTIGVSPIAANRNVDVWGSDADVFRPDRWLESAEKTRYLNLNDMTFGGNGARMCIGRNLALVEIHKFVAQFLRTFEFNFVDSEKPWRVHSQWFANQFDMLMHIRLRS